MRVEQQIQTWDLGCTCISDKPTPVKKCEKLFDKFILCANVHVSKNRCMSKHTRFEGSSAFYNWSCAVAMRNHFNKLTSRPLEYPRRSQSTKASVSAQTHSMASIGTPFDCSHHDCVCVKWHSGGANVAPDTLSLIDSQKQAVDTGNHCELLCMIGSDQSPCDIQN